MRARWWLAVVYLFILIPGWACTTSMPTNSEQVADTLGDITVRVPQTPYGKLVITNNTTRDILVPTSQDARVNERTFRFYRHTTTGWARLYPKPGYYVPPIADEPGLVILSGNTREINIGPTLNAYSNSWMDPFGEPLQGEFMVQVRYHWQNGPEDGETVLYSNPFLLRTANPVQDQEVRVDVDKRSPFALQIHNGASKPIWVPSICCPVPVYRSHTAFSDDGYLSLQYQTEVGAYRIFRGDKDRCDPKGPLQVDPGQTVTMDAGPWLQSQIEDLTGTYRWEVVFYQENVIVGGERMLRDARHIFSETFSYEK